MELAPIPGVAHWRACEGPNLNWVPDYAEGTPLDVARGLGTQQQNVISWLRERGARPPLTSNDMRTIGLLGGMSWESSADYYRLLNEIVKSRLGGLHSAKCLMLSVDFAEIEALQREGNWDEAGRRLAVAARSLERGGADFIVLCTNTMHEVAAAIEGAVQIPLLHIADPTATRVVAEGLHTIGLLGTRYTMERDFYRSRLSDRGLVVLIPDEPDRTLVHDVIYGELVLGRVEDRSRRAYLEVIDRLVARGAQGVVLGCTEIGMLIKPTDLAVPTFDTTRLHAEHAVAVALADGARGSH